MNLYFNKVAVDGIAKSKFFWEFIKPIMKKKSHLQKVRGRPLLSKNLVESNHTMSL